MITLIEMEEARARIAPYIRRTGLEKNATLSEQFGASMYLKYELMQKTGSFKPRGAFNQFLQLNEAQRDRGVVAVSGGNFAQAVAYAAKILNVDAVICMPSYTPRNYVEATAAYGAKIELVGDFPSTLARAQTLREEGRTLLHAWDDRRQLIGNATLGLEIMEQLPNMTDIVISIGGGGLIAGVAAAIKLQQPHINIWGVETEGAPTLGAALKAGKVVQITPSSLAKTLSAPYVSEEALYTGQNWLAGYLTVSDRDAAIAQTFLLERAKILTELAAACTLAAAQTIRNRFNENSHVVLLMCGGNDSFNNMLMYKNQFAL